ncbi:MAG: hypothetical protein WBW14_28090 [Candidatus Acidiferrum sp.]
METTKTPPFEVCYSASRQEVMIKFKQPGPQHPHHIGLVVLPLQDAMELGSQLYHLLDPVYSRVA